MDVDVCTLVNNFPRQDSSDAIVACELSRARLYDLTSVSSENRKVA